MKHWSNDDRAEFDLVVEMAWRAGENDYERTDEFIQQVRDAEQAQRSWAVDVLNAALREGMWVRLKKHHRAIAPLKVAFAGRTHSVSRLAGIARKSQAGSAMQQLELADMTRDELLAKQGEHEATEYAARRNKYVVTLLIELIDSAPGATTARQAAASLGVDIEQYLMSA